MCQHNGMIKVLLQVLAKHISHEIVQVYGCRALASIANSNLAFPAVSALGLNQVAMTAAVGDHHHGDVKHQFTAYDTDLWRSLPQEKEESEMETAAEDLGEWVSYRLAPVRYTSSHPADLYLSSSLSLRHVQDLRHTPTDKALSRGIH